MSKIKGDVGSLSAIIAQELEQWQMDKEKEVKRALTKRARECKNRITQSSPVRYGLYSSAWRGEAVYESQRAIRIIIHNRDYPGLTHLLEYGHAIKPGTGRVLGIPHIKPAEEEAKANVEEDLKKIFGGA